MGLKAKSLTMGAQDIPLRVHFLALPTAVLTFNAKKTPAKFLCHPTARTISGTKLPLWTDKHTTWWHQACCQKLGLHPSDISARSIQASGAMALLLGGVQPVIDKALVIES
eukprot:7339273-Ditylum_brightwellii.AAC.2